MGSWVVQIRGVLVRLLGEESQVHPQPQSPYRCHTQYIALIHRAANGAARLYL